MVVNGLFEFVKAEIGKASKKDATKKFNMATLSQDYKLSYVFFDDDIISKVEKLDRGQLVECKMNVFVGKDYSSASLIDVVDK